MTGPEEKKRWASAEFIAIAAGVILLILLLIGSWAAFDAFLLAVLFAIAVWLILRFALGWGAEAHDGETALTQTRSGVVGDAGTGVVGASRAVPPRTVEQPNPDNIELERGTVVDGTSTGSGTIKSGIGAGASGAADGSVSGASSAGGAASAASSGADSASASGADSASASGADSASASGAGSAAASGSASGATSAGAGTTPAAAISPSATLPGQDDLAERKGSWRYDGGDDGAASAASGDVEEEPAEVPAMASGGVPDVAEAGGADDEPQFEGDGERPEALSAARDGGPDDLKQIKGVGPKLEGLLHELGIYHFDQIGGWGAPEVAWMDSNLQGFRGRVSRDEWVAQAKILAAGGTTEFSKKVDKGGVY